MNRLLLAKRRDATEEVVRRLMLDKWLKSRLRIKQHTPMKYAGELEMIGFSCGMRESC